LIFIEAGETEISVLPNDSDIITMSEPGSGDAELSLSNNDALVSADIGNTEFPSFRVTMVTWLLLTSVIQKSLFL